MRLEERCVMQWHARLQGMNLRCPHDSNELDQVLRYLACQLPELEGRIKRAAERAECLPTGGQCFVILDGDKATKDQLALEYVYGDVWSPWHRHGVPSEVGRPGERIVATYDGCLIDRLPNGAVVRHRVGDPSYDHPPNSFHAPVIIGGWVGLFWQPAGSVEVTFD